MRTVSLVQQMGKDETRLLHEEKVKTITKACSSGYEVVLGNLQPMCVQNCFIDGAAEC